jgi:hypothetical protein
MEIEVLPSHKCFLLFSSHHAPACIGHHQVTLSTQLVIDYINYNANMEFKQQKQNAVLEDCNIINSRTQNPSSRIAVVPVEIKPSLSKITCLQHHHYSNPFSNLYSCLFLGRCLATGLHNNVIPSLTHLKVRTLQLLPLPPP